MSGMWKHIDDTPKEKEAYPYALAIQIANVVSFIAVAIVNALNSTGTIGESNGEISDRYPTRITPDGWAFAIWGIIYFFNAVFIIYQAFPSQRENPVIFRDINLLYLFVNIFNFIWTFIFANDEIWASAVIITLILICLLVAYVRIGVGRKEATPVLEYLCVHITFSIYFAWLSVATIVNWSVALKGKGGWDGSPWTEEGWAILMMCIVTVLTIVLLIHRTDWTYGAVIAWAFIAIGTKQSSFDPMPTAAFTLGGIHAAFSFLALIAKVILWRKERANQTPPKETA